MKPILFNTEMVQAIQDGRKTVTRRLLKPHNPVKAKECGYYQGSGLWYDDTFNEGDKDTHIKDYSVSCCWIGTKIYIQKYAQYKVGDILYVRETWCKGSLNYGEEQYWYKADNKIPHCQWSPSIHMPKEAARIFLRVTGVRVERLQDIKIADVVSEGVSEMCQECFEDYGNGFQCCVGESDECGIYDDTMSNWQTLWNSTVKKSDLKKYGWAANPWVWVIKFERLEVT